jgi:hypothetical protein
MHRLYEIKQHNNTWLWVKIAHNFGFRDPTWPEVNYPSGGFVGTLGASNLFPAPAILIRVKLMFSLKVKVNILVTFLTLT